MFGNILKCKFCGETIIRTDYICEYCRTRYKKPTSDLLFNYEVEQQGYTVILKEKELPNELMVSDYNEDLFEMIEEMIAKDIAKEMLNQGFIKIEPKLDTNNCKFKMVGKIKLAN